MMKRRRQAKTACRGPKARTATGHSNWQPSAAWIPCDDGFFFHVDHKLTVFQLQPRLPNGQTMRCFARCGEVGLEHRLLLAGKNHLRLTLGPIQTCKLGWL